MKLRGIASVMLAASAASCAADPPVDRCEVSQRTLALTAAERKVVGEASPYPADPLLRARTDELITSQRARREAAWAAVARVLEPVALAQDVPAQVGPEYLPRWHTWYGRDDMRRLFQKIWRALPVSIRDARGPLPAADLDAAFAWNPHAVEEDVNWPESRWTAYLDSLDDAADVAGTGGIARVGYAPAAARHLLASYAQEVDCFEHGAPAAFVDGPPQPPTVTREPLALAACEERVFGPYFVADGEQLSARADHAEVTLHRDASDGEAACVAAPGEPCELDGPGAIWVSAASIGDPVDGELVIEHAAPDALWAGCLDGRFPETTAVVKADWRRAELGFQVEVHDTSAAGLDALGPDADWGLGDGMVDPGADLIYTARTSVGNLYRLVGLHVMTRELDHWLWITLWWSPDPDDDFGADRPAAITALGGPWGSYKMCTTVAFAEGDADPTGGFTADHPTLAAALAEVHAGDGGPSWCSNPYLEQGPGNAATNCVGCHQHGGTGLPITDILDGPAFPEHGRVQVRNNFPADYAWATDDGDRLAQLFRDEIVFWDDVE